MTNKTCKCECRAVSSANLFPMFVAERVAVLKTGPICVGGNVQKSGHEHFQ